MKKLLLTLGLMATTAIMWSQSSDKSSTEDTDFDYKFNNCDVDSDNDGIIDILEDFNGNGIFEDDDQDGDLVAISSLGDATGNYLDLDSDNDGILDLHESGLPADLIYYLDKNMNGIIDIDIIVGDNGFADTLETYPDSGIPNFTLADRDGDGIPDFLDLTSDGENYDMYLAGYDSHDIFGFGFFYAGYEDLDEDGIMHPKDTDLTNRGSPASFILHNFTYTLPPHTETGDKYDFCGLIAPLNMKELNLHGNYHNQMNQLEWTSVLSNVSVYEIFHSENGTQYHSIGKAKSNDQKEYGFAHVPKNIVNFYKIVAINTNGQSVESNVLRLEATSLKSISVYPNPSSNKLYINNIQDNSQINIYNAIGQLVLNLDKASGLQEISISHWTPGNYFIEIIHPNGQSNIQKFQKIN